GRSIMGAVDPEDTASASQAFQRCLDRPGIPIHLPVRKTHSDGSTRVLHVVLLNKLADPEIQAVVLQYRDVTAVIATEERDAANQKRSAILSAITELLAESFDSANILQKLTLS